GGVFGGVQRAGQIGRREPCVGEGLFVGVPPAGGRAQGVHGQFQRVGADQVHAGQTAAFVPGDLFADVHQAVGPGDRAPVLGGSGAHDADVFIAVGAGAVADLDLGHGGDVVLVGVHADGSALVHVHSAGVHGSVSTGGIHRPPHTSCH